MIFFFFQAEDGIRGGHVTGVQTCALPILANYEQFMEKGNTIVLFSENPEGVFQLETTFNLDFTEEQSFEYQNTSYQLDTMPIEHILTEEDDKIILQERYDEDEEYGLSRSYDNGKIIVIKMRSPLMNGRILD